MLGGDKDLEVYRKLMEPPGTYEEGFSWTAVFGAMFIGFLMVPGSIYMGLLAGTGIGSAATGAGAAATGAAIGRSTVTGK